MKPTLSKILIIPMLLAALVPVFTMTSCGKSHDELNQVTFMPLKPTDDTTRCTLDPASFLGTDTRFTVELPTNEATLLKISFSCDKAVKWKLENTPADMPADPSAGEGSGYFVMSIPTNNTGKGRTEEFRMILVQEYNNGDVVSLGHRFIIKQP